MVLRVLLVGKKKKVFNFIYIRSYYYYVKQECGERDAPSRRREGRKPIALDDSSLPTLAGSSCHVLPKTLARSRATARITVICS